MGTDGGEEGQRGWRQLSPAERRALTPLQRELAKLRDAEADRAAARRRVARAQHRASEAEQKLDGRRTFVVGRLVRAAAADANDPKSRRVAGWLRELADARLDDPEERALFDLPPRPDAGRSGLPPPVSDPA